MRFSSFTSSPTVYKLSEVHQVQASHLFAAINETDPEAHCRCAADQRWSRQVYLSWNSLESVEMNMKVGNLQVETVEVSGMWFNAKIKYVIKKWNPASGLAS